MSIGEYYKLLMEGKRPMRSRNQGQSEPPKQTSANSSAQPPNQIQKAKKPEQQQIAAKDKSSSSSVTKLPEKGAQDQKAKEQILPNLDRKRKEKERAKEKMKLQHRDDKKSSTAHNTISVMKNQILKVQDDGGGIGSDVLKLQQSTMIKTQNAANQSSIDQKKKAGKPADVALEQIKEEKKHQNSNEEDKEQEKAGKDDRRVVEKFESIEPHPNYCKGRYAYSIENKLIQPITQVSEDCKTFTIGKEEEKEQSQSSQSKFNFVGKVFIAKVGIFEPFSGLESHLKTANINDNHILIAQAIKHNEEQLGQLNFITFLLKSNSQYQAIDLKLKDNINPYKEIKDYEEDLLGSTLKSAYKQDQLQHYLEFAEKLHKQFLSYFNKVKAILITKENMDSLLYTVVSYEQGAISAAEDIRPLHKQRQGILLRIKYDPHYQDYLLFMRLINYKNTQKERTEWFQLTKYRIKADLTRGFVSLDFISTLENINNSAQKLRPRAFQMLDYKANQEQIKQLRNISDVQDHQEKPRTAIILKTLNNDRCSYCNYITNEIEHLQCFSCQKVYHYQCLKNPEVHSNLGLRENFWRCQDCIRCTNCLSVRNRNQILHCQECNSAYHFDCLDHTFKLSVPNFHPTTTDSSTKEAYANNSSAGGSKKINLNQLNEVYRCEQCVVCEHCGAKEAGDKRKNKWSKDFKLCSICNKKRQNNQFCLVCERFWPDQPNSQQEEGQLQIKQEKQHDIISCGQCEMSIHMKCDRIFEYEEAKKSLTQDKSLQYQCQKCRQLGRTQLIQQLIEKLAQEDKYYIFQEPVEQHVQNYTKIIKNPMCFKYLRQKIPSYLRNPEQLRSDVALIFQNAIVFNVPKHKVHKEALKLKDVCDNLIKLVWNKLDKNKQRTLDEDTHLQRMKDEAQSEKIQRLGSGKDAQEDDANMDELEEPQYNMRPDELFEAQEHQIAGSGLGQQSAYGSNVFGGQSSANQPAIQGQRDDQEMEGSDFENAQRALNNQEEYDSDDPAVNMGGIYGDHTKGSHQDTTMNLRIRKKQINYNEDRLLISGAQGQLDPLNLSGSKRGHTQAFKTSASFSGLDDAQPADFPGGNSIRSLKRQRQQQHQFLLSNALHSSAIQDPDFIPPGNQSSYQPLRHTMSAANLLQQAIQQESSKLQQQDQHHDRDDQKQDHQQQTQNHIQQQQQMMMNYYQEIDDEKCYYSNPARCSYDDPTLLFEEMCYLCGSFGNREDFLSCTLCGESFHTYCLQLPDDRVQKFQPYWKCLNCKFCEICASATQEAFLLYCDVCDKAFHSFCLKPQLKSIPNCQWKCQECFQCQQCGTKEFFSVEDTEQRRNMEVTDFEFSQNFSYCYQCGLNEYKKSFCKICQKKSEDQDSSQEGNSHSKKRSGQLSLMHHNSLTQKGSKSLQKRDQMMKCTTCGFYSHLRCSRLLPLSLNSADPDDPSNAIEQSQQDYKCLECLLTGKTINHLIRETCEHYENIHQIISRQKLLANLCQDILARYFPIQEKAPLFIKSFIDQNQEFFRKDEIMQEWLTLLESNVCFEQPYQEPKEDADMDDADKQQDEDKAAKDGQNDSSPKEKKQLEQAEEAKEKDKEEEVKVSQIQKKEVEYKKWEDVSFKDVFQKFDKNPLSKNKEQTQAQKVYQEMYGHKETFLPEKRNLYKSLTSSETHRFGQRQHFMTPSELAPMITVPTEENLQKINLPELYVRIELKAVMRIKLQFFRWFEDLIKSILKNNQKFLRKERKKQELIQKQQEEPLEMDMIAADQDNTGKNMQSADDQLCTDLDTLVSNPQQKLYCVLCRLNGELAVTGRLIPFQVNQFVHVNCAFWSTDVYEIGDGQLINFFFVHAGKSRITKCVVCQENGATIICFTRKCHSAFHFPCAYRNNKVAFLRTKETYCDQCSRQRGLIVGYLQEFSTKRRFQIAKNQTPWNMSTMLQQQLMQQPSQFGSNMNGINSQNHQLMALQQTQLNLNTSSIAELEKQLHIEKWRPFYFDMFNRVGNLTVLSLKREINQLIEEALGNKNANLEQLTDFAAIRVYWKFYKDSMMQIEEGDEIKKTYYLYSNNQVREIIKHDLQTLIPFASEKIREKIQVGMHFLHSHSNLMIEQNDRQDILMEQQSIISGRRLCSISKKKDQISHYRTSYSQYLSLEEKLNTQYQFGIEQKPKINHSSQNQALKFSQLKINHLSKTEGKTIDDIFKRMIKINQMGENQLAPMKRLTSSKHMKYENMLNMLGKKLFYSKHNQLDGNPNHNAHHDKQALAKKIRLTDTIDTNKEIDLPIAMKYRLSKAQPKRVEVGPSKIHRNGLFTLEDLMPGDIVIEYVGEKIRNKVADKREIYYEQKGIGDCYLFRLDKEYIIDATFFGNKARYLNHSCDANCSAKIINVQQQKHIIISTNRAIKSGEELTYNYNFDYEADKLECFCGAPTCLGRLN